MNLSDRIAADHTVKRMDTWWKYHRIVFDFEGHEAWVVEPDCEPAAGAPWTWTMQWADAYVDRTGCLDLLKKGWRHVTIDTFRHRMDNEGIAVSHRFQNYLVGFLGFAPKSHLIGMSWGGFFSTRYALAHPECVRRIYLDAPLLTFHGFPKGATPTQTASKIGPWGQTSPADGDWSKDPRMPMSNVETLAKTGIPVLLLFGGQDQTVDPSLNAEPFAARFLAAGGMIDVHRRDLYGHHPHGEDPDKTGTITSFFESTLDSVRR